MTDAPSTANAHSRRCFVALVASLFILYNRNFRAIHVLDLLPTTLLPAIFVTGETRTSTSFAGCSPLTTTDAHCSASTRCRNETGTPWSSESKLVKSVLCEGRV